LPQGASSVAGACSRPRMPLSCLRSLHNASGRSRAGPDSASRRPTLRTTPSRRRLHPHTSIYYFCASSNRAACVVGRLRLRGGLRAGSANRASGAGIRRFARHSRQQSALSPMARASQAQLKYINCIARANSGPPRRLPPQRARPDPGPGSGGPHARPGPGAPGGPRRQRPQRTAPCAIACAHGRISAATPRHARMWLWCGGTPSGGRRIRPDRAAPAPLVRPLVRQAPGVVLA
jgi:hypothetical protein